jgi:hypothetical protein
MRKRTVWLSPVALLVVAIACLPGRIASFRGIDLSPPLRS